MNTLFIFGTLRHEPLLKAVLGDVSHLKLSQAFLADHAVLGVTEGPFPMIVQQSDAMAEGLTVAGLTDQDVARLDFYEGAFEYALQTVELADGQFAQAYFPKPGLWTGQGPWSLREWARDWGEMSVLAAEEVLSYLGQKTPSEVGAMFPMVRARAWSALNARESLHGALTLKGRVDICATSRVYAKYFALDEYVIKHEQFDGSLSQDVSRAVFRAPDAALVLPYDPKRDRVLLVEQIRMGPLARGDKTLWQLEPIAGRLDPGETPQETARREAREEAGLEIGVLETVAQTYCSPGNSSEFYYIYVGHANLPDDVTGVAGLDVEDEDIKSHVLSFDELMILCADLQVANAPLVMAAYWLAHHRQRLRESVNFQT